MNKYPNFRRAQRERGPYYKGPPLPASPVRLNFAVILFASSAIMFAVVYFSDQLGAAARSFGVAQGIIRQNAPQSGAFYRGCNDARAAGVAPLYRGEPGYRPEMDGDSDGIACEPYRGR